MSALPDFSFNPAGTPKPAGVGVSPPNSPLANASTPSRPIGHRRGGSEFIGGDGRAGAGVAPLLSSSPTRGDAFLPPPPNANPRPGPPAGRRGHAHRRSGAISSHDLSTIMRPADTSTAPRGGSAPVTPLEGDQFVFGHSVNKSVSQPSLRDNGFFPDDPNASPKRPPSRARVGFSDKVEYIRPLSTISSETETSLSTIRGHSATGSLSSIVSAGASTPPRMARPALNTAVENEGRPSTAGAILDLSPRKSPHFGGDLFTRKRPMSAVSPASPTKTTSPVASPSEPAKRRSFFPRLESRRSDPIVPRLPTSASDPALSASHLSSLPSPMKEDVECTSSVEKDKSTSRKSRRKPRKVKSWANSIIRKGKHSRSKARAPTPPGAAVDLDDTSESEEDVDFEANFDVDNTVTIVSESENADGTNNDGFASWKPRALKRVDSDTMSPVIDLDAALGPFNTPNGASPRTGQRGFGAHRRALHSAGMQMQNHRRTESAPELAPFELRPTALGTTSAMADVFEEDEPEEDISTSKPPVSPAKVETKAEEVAEEPKIQVVEGESSQNSATINWNFDDGLKIRRGDKPNQPACSEPLSPLQVPQPVPEARSSGHSVDVSPVEVVEDYEEPRTSSLTHSSDSTITPQAAEETKSAKPVMSVPLPLTQQSVMTPDTFTSSFSSPDFRSSQASFDTPRLGTAASSMTDYRVLPSPHFGEPGPELRVSTDDVPSLTSSRSTMTSAMQSAFPVMSPRRPSDRSTSLCSVSSDIEIRRRKRSSIASLSRLINGSSYGERSKLSIEQRPHSEYLEPARESKKKHKGLSKLKFWKTKEASAA